MTNASTKVCVRKKKEGGGCGNEKWIFRGCLVHPLKYTFSVFKQHYTHFHTLFHPHVLPHMFLNNKTHVFKQQNTCFQTHVPNTPLGTILLTRRISSYNNKQTTNAGLASINTNFVRENMHHGILS